MNGIKYLRNIHRKDSYTMAFNPLSSFKISLFENV